MRPPDSDEGAPGERGPSNVVPTDFHIVLPTGCLCGHVAGEPCKLDRPVPDRDGHCCGVLGFEELAACRRLGITCGDERCARVTLELRAS